MLNFTSNRTIPRPTNEPNKRIQAAVYCDQDGNELFVPTAAAWAWHEATKPKSILGRIGIPGHRWHAWQQGLDSWVIDWLRRKCAIPEGEKIPKLSKEMARFRKLTSQRETHEFLKAQGIEGISQAVRIPHTLRQDWINDWIFHGETAPAGKHVVTVRQLECCRAAWDYREVLREVNQSENNYCRFFGQFPTENLGEFSTWLYGGPVPNGWYIAHEKAVELRNRLCLTGIANAAGLSPQTVYYWRQDPTKWQAVEDAMERAKRGRLGAPIAWKSLFDSGELIPVAQAAKQKMMNAMLEYAKAATMKSALADVGITATTWQQWQKSADEQGGTILKDALAEFVTGGRSHDDPFDYGIAAPGLFVPSPALRAFRETIASRVAAQTIYQIRARFPERLFQEWFLDCVVPRTFRPILDGKRKTPPTAPRRVKEVTPPAACEPEIQTVSIPADPPKATTPDLSDPVDAEPPVILSDLQNEILLALDRKAMTADELQDHLNVGRHALFGRRDGKGGLNELKALERVKNEPGIRGYYRPDAPPTQI